jgi:hypothetical protein
MTNLKTMLLVTAPWSPEANTFRMIPASQDCPYLDVVYNRDKKALEITSTFKRNEYAMFAKVNENGDPEMRKSPKVDEETGQQIIVKQERRMTELLQKYFILDQVEIIAFVQAFGINADKVDFMQHFQGPVVEAPKPSIIMP